MKRRILIVTYYWPPAGGIGVQRWLQFSKYLAELGNEVFVYAPENPSYPIIDESLNAQIPENVTVIKQKIWEPYRIAEFLNPKNKDFKKGQFNTKNPSLLSKLSVYIRGNFFIPDARKFWVKPSVKFLKKFIPENEIDTVITSGPPHSLHLIGLDLKKENPDLQWLADFRDPWTGISYHHDLRLNKKSQKKHRELEGEVLQNADTVLAASFTDAENYKKSGAKNSVSMINGYEQLMPGKNEKNEKFTISYIGKLEQQRNPSGFWRAIEALIEENQDFRDNMQIQLVGSIDDDVIAQLKQSNFKNNLIEVGYVNYEDAKNYMQKSDLLLLSNFENEQSKGIIPGKLFEYLASQNPIVSLGPKDADVAKILEDTRSGEHFGNEDIEQIKEYTLNQYNNWKNDKNFLNSLQLDNYSRKNIANKLNKIIHYEKND